MAMIAELKALFDQWIAAVAEAVDSLIDRCVHRRQILLSDAGDNTLTATLLSARKDPVLADVSFRLSNGRPSPPLPADWQTTFRGSRVEVRLTSGQVLLRSLDFPKQAVDFLDGMIRAQIDRLMPWTADEVVFGWSPPSASANERVELTLAAMSKHDIEPFVQLAAGLGAASVAAFAELADGGSAPARIKVFDKSLRGAIGQAVDVPRILRMVLLSAGVAAAACLIASAYIGNTLDAEQEQLQRRISQRRTALRLDPNAAGGSALNLLAKRKQVTPSSVMVLEALSRALPDSTYVTELRIEGDKVQVVGMTQDAPSLIRLMERSPQFARATFFAPTTRAQNDPRERFHIEAHVTPSFGSGT
jgi:general secretion pathway protein L